MASPVLHGFDSRHILFFILKIPKYCAQNIELDKRLRDVHFFCFSSMSGGLSSSCLQQRDPGGYPYMFHDPLHSLSSSYNSRAAAAACNPAVAHAQPTTHPSYAASGTPTTAPPSTGTGMF